MRRRPQTEVPNEAGRRPAVPAVAEGEDGLGISDRIAREGRFDPDIWVVAVEDREGRAFLDTV